MHEIPGYDHWKATEGNPYYREEESDEMGDNWQDIGTHVNDVAAEMVEQNKILRAICLELAAARAERDLRRYEEIRYIRGESHRDAETARDWAELKVRPVKLIDAANAATAEVERMFSAASAEKGE